jgi:hypothetical protein
LIDFISKDANNYSSEEIIDGGVMLVLSMFYASIHDCNYVESKICIDRLIENFTANVKNSMRVHFEKKK